MRPWSGRLVLALVLGLGAACSPAAAPQQGPQPGSQRRRLPSPLPDSTGWGVHVLALAVDPRGGLWAGTFGQGIFVLRNGTNMWEHLVPRAGSNASISGSSINGFAFTRDGTIWYGTVGNGFGRSTDGGRTWRNWTQRELGPHWQYVTHNGLRSRGDTVYIATSDGLRISGDAGATWRCIVAAEPVAAGEDRQGGACNERINALPSEYLLSLDVGGDGRIWAGHLHGLSVSKDGGRTWRPMGLAQGVPTDRIRAIAATPDSMNWVATEDRIVVDSLDEGEFVEATVKLPGWSGLPGKPRAIVPTPGVAEPSIVLSFGLAAGNGLGDFRVYYVAAGDAYRPASDMWSMAWTGPPLWPVGGSAYGLQTVLAGRGPEINFMDVGNAQMPAEPRHPRYPRPITDGEGNPFVDPTNRYGSSFAGQPHQSGIDFQNPAGTPVHSVADGVVAFAGPTANGSNTVAILHDARIDGRFIYSSYAANSSIVVNPGEHVSAGQVIARTGNTGGVRSGRLNLTIQSAPMSDSAAVFNPTDSVPAWTVNPELYLEPRAGTGTVVGRVLDANGQPVHVARVYGLVLPYPTETPFSWAETYDAQGESDPAYSENLAISDVPAGTYTVGVDIAGKRVWRRVRVEAGRVTIVEFRP
jgi:murein DD-endopeptidase MepM/ murein hydrolase activator NlpD